MSDLFNAIAMGLLALLPLLDPPTTVALFLALIVQSLIDSNFHPPRLP